MTLLEGLRVVDLTDVRGALAGRMLADLGASVLRIRLPLHDRHDDTDAARTFRDANKHVVAIDIETEVGRSEIDRRLAAADVVIENFGNRDRARLGFEAASIREAFPEVVHVAIADMGLHGPRSDWLLEPLTALAASGGQFASGFPDLPPCSIQGFLAHDCASVFGAVGAVAALMERRRSGQGQCVEISVQEAALAGLIPWSIPIADYAHVVEGLPVNGERRADGYYHVLPAADGHIRTIVANEPHWKGFVDLCGNPEVFASDEWLEGSFRRQNADVLKLVASEGLAKHSRADLADRAAHNGATLGIIHRSSEYVAHEQTRHRQFFTQINGELLAASPFTIDGVRPPVRLASAALPDWHGRSPWAPATEQVAPTTQRPLEGVCVVEFGMAAVIPECNYILSELGADVIKIESATRPDILRASGGKRINCGYSYNVECRGRRNVALDLSTPSGRQIALDLCAQADVVTENYRGGTLDRLGLGEAHVRAVNPAVLYVSSQGYGRGGPMGETPAWGPLNSSFSSTHYLWNHPGAPYPCGTSMNHPDHIAGRFISMLVLAALDRRNRTGEGADIELAQSEAAAYLMGELFVQLHRTGVDPEPLGNRSLTAAPHNTYVAAGTDQWISIVCSTTEAFVTLASVAGFDIEPAWHSTEERLADAEAIDALVEAWTSSISANNAATALQERGVSAMPVMGPADHRSDPHLDQRCALVDLVHPEVGPERHVDNPMRFSDLTLRTAGPAPGIGDHTHEILTSKLGYTIDQVDDLVAEGVCR